MSPQSSSKVYEFAVDTLMMRSTQDFIMALPEDATCAVFFHGDEETFPGFLMIMRQRFRTLYHVLLLSRRTRFSKFKKLAPFWVIQNLYLCPKQFSVSDLESLTSSEICAFLTQLQHTGVIYKILPYQNYIPTDHLSEGVVQWQTQAITTTSGTPKVSIIIPTRNYGHFVVNTLRHLTQQTLDKKHFEIILVDDQSTDQTFEWTKTFVAPQTESVQFIFLRHQNTFRTESQFCAGHCRNLGLQVARGKIILFLDSDILLPSDYLEGLIQQMKTADVIQSPRLHIKPSQSGQWTELKNLKTQDLYIEEKKYWQSFFETESWQQLPHFWRYTCTYTLAVRRECLDEVGVFREVFQSYGFEDTELGYRLAKAQKRFHLWKKNVYHLTPARENSRYSHSMATKHSLLSKTAKVFFLSTLDPEVYYLLRPYFVGEGLLKQKLYRAYCQIFKRSIPTQHPSSRTGQSPQNVQVRSPQTVPTRTPHTVQARNPHSKFDDSSLGNKPNRNQLPEPLDLLVPGERL